MWQLPPAATMRQRFLSFLASTEPAPKPRGSHLRPPSASLAASATMSRNQVVIKATPVGPAEAHYTQYTIICSQPGSHQWWVAFRRYSEFVTFRKQCSKALKGIQKSDHAQALAPFMDSLVALGRCPFPPKHFIVDDAVILAERKAGLAIFVEHVLSSYDDARRLMTMLGVAQRVLVEAWLRLATTFLVVPPDARTSRRRHTTLCAADAVCSICLGSIDDKGDDDRRSAGAVFETKCHHHYHRKCILPWLEKTQTCPMCRHRVVSGRWY